MLWPKRISKIRYWNERTMLQTGETAQVCNEMRNYGLEIDILGVNECKWTKWGWKFLLNDEKHIIYSRRDDYKHTEGVVILMSRRAERALVN